MLVEVAEPGALPAPNVWYATGTGIGTFTPTIPTCTREVKSRAVSPSRVKMATPLPYSC